MKGFWNMLLHDGWQRDGRGLIERAGAEQTIAMIHSIPDQPIDYEAKRQALEAVRVCTNVLDYNESKLADIERSIQMERLAAQIGSITWDEFYEYEQAKRAEYKPVHF